MGENRHSLQAYAVTSSVLYTLVGIDENTEPLVVVLGRIPAAQREELERRAREDDRTLSWVVRQAVDHYLQFEGRADHHPALPSIHHATKGAVT